MKDEITKLESPAPLPDNLKKFNALYPVFFIIGIMVGLIGDATWYMMGLIGLIVALIIKSIIATKLDYSLSKMSFETPRLISGSEMAGLIAIPLTQLGMAVTVDGKEAVVTYMGMQYYIRNYTDGSFGLIFDGTLASRVLTGRRYISQYKKAIVAISLIAYTIQNEMEKTERIQGDYKVESVDER